MRQRFAILAAAVAIVLALSCGDDGSPTDPSPAESFPVASTPERFLALLDSAVSTTNFPLYRSLIDSSYVCHPFTQYDWPGDTTTAWGCAEEMAIMERMLTGSGNYFGLELQEASVRTTPDTAYVDTTSVASDSLIPPGYVIRFRMGGELRTDADGEWGHGFLYFSSLQTIALRPDPRRPGHLVAVDETESDPWDIGSRSPPRYSWGFAKSMFREGAETPEEFLRRFAETFPRHGTLLSTGFEFHSSDGDIARGIPEVIPRSDAIHAFDEIRNHRTNPQGWRSSAIHLTLTPKSMVESETPAAGKASASRQWVVSLEARLDVTLRDPNGVEEEFSIAGDQSWVLGSSSNTGGLTLSRQYDLSDPAEPSNLSWGYLMSLFLPEDPETVAERLLSAYRRGDLEGYASTLDSSFLFQMEKPTPRDPAPAWDRAEELRTAERIFDGSANARDQKVVAWSLSGDVIDVVRYSGFEPDRRVGESWYAVTVDVDAAFSIDEGDGLAPVTYGTEAEHRFLVRPTAEVPVRFMVVRQFDPEPLDFGPDWETGKTPETDYLELDANGILGDVPEHRQCELGDTIAVDCWMIGSAATMVWGVTVCPLTPALRFVDAIYHLPADWSHTDPTPYIECTTLSAQMHAGGQPITLPHLAATYRFVAVEDDVYTGFRTDAGNSAWLAPDGHTSGTFFDAGGLKIRVGHPTTKPSSWGSTKAMFR